MLRISALIGLLFIASVGVCAQEAEPVTVLYCGTLLDIPGQPPRIGATIVLAGNRIVDVADGFVDPPEGAKVIDLRDRFVLPGLIDCHTHITHELEPGDDRLRRMVQEGSPHAAIHGVVFAERTLLAGFTTIRNVGSSGGVAFALRDKIAEGVVPGPRILAAGEAITATGGHGDSTNGIWYEFSPAVGAEQGVADGPDEVRKAVRSQIKQGADLIKITATGGVLSNTAAGVDQQLFVDELEAIVTAANMMGRKVAAHAHGVNGIKAALRAGVDSIEHGTYLDDEAIALFLETGAYLVPTIHAGKYVEQMAEVDGYFPEPIRAKAAAVGPVIQGAFGRAHAAGVKIAFGTDVGVGRHGTNALEFVYMTEAGMSPADALVTATINAADLCGLSDDIGTIEPGKLADIIAVRHSPLDDVTVLQDVSFVMKDGTVYKDDR